MIPMKRSFLLAVTAASIMAPGAHAAEDPLRKSIVQVGRDATGQACTARRVYGDALADNRADRAYDLICGASEATPVGRLYVFGADPSGSLERWRQDVGQRCANPRDQSWAPTAIDVKLATFCGGEPAGLNGAKPGRTASVQLAGRAGNTAIAGDVLPAAAPALERAMRVFLKLEAEPQADAPAGPRSALLDSLQAALGNELSGGGFADFLTLRRVAFENNSLWMFSAAERQFADALRIHTTIWPLDYAGRADLQTERALNLANQRRFPEAEALLAQARVNAQKSNNTFMIAKAQSYSALTALNAGDMRGADARAQEAMQSLAAWRASDAAREDLNTDQTAGSIPLAQRATILEAQMLRTLAAARAADNAADARASLQRAGVAAGKLDQRVGGWLRAGIVQDIAGLDMKANRPAEAARALEAALSTYRAVATRTRIEANLLMDLGDAELALGATNQGTARFREAFAIYREQPENRGVSAGRAQPYLRALIGAAPGGQDLAADLFDAFETVSSPAVAQTAAATAARLQAGPNGKAIRDWQDSERNLRRALTRRSALPGEASLVARQDLDNEIALLRSQTAQLKQAVDVEFPNYGVVTLQPVSLSELQNALGSNERVIRIAIGPISGAGLIIDKASVRAFPIALGEAKATELVNRIKSSVRNPDLAFDDAAARDLFGVLFADVRDDLLSEGAPKRLVIEASGALASLPFGVLLTGPDEAAGSPWLAKRFAMITAPSMRAFVSARAAGPSKGSAAFAGFGDFVPATDAGRTAVAQSIVRARALPAECVEALKGAIAKYPALSGTAQELAAVQSITGADARAMFLRDRFTANTVMEADVLRSARVVMFATHGIFAADLPEAKGCMPEAALMTSVGESGLFLDSAQVLDLKLDADLVVLSACDTGNPQAIAPGDTGLPSGGDALSGLARSFFYAGARSVLVSHWVLPDEDTVAVMTTFFKRLEAGDPPPEAMQAAQMAQMARGAADPLQWAAFAIVGAPPAR
jgi:CHAT domain-containing protein/cellobiose-specific phosphotransferase system component IIA